ncbi:MAG: hypothetical protein U5K79_24410 [Cyclobacteriaceae bacterium]|nr:hypothetical protein [Cyclobacteriaceae bacterium]
MISKQSIVRTGIRLSILNLALTTAVGTFLRYHKVFPFYWLNDRYWTHAHSHTGFLGWMFMAFAITAFAMQMPDLPKLNKRMYRIIIGLQLSVLGMLVTFPFTGYGLYSIIFSTAHTVLAAIFIFQYFKNSTNKLLSVRLMRVAMVFFLISGLGPMTLGPLAVAGLQGTAWYDMAVYFYLHFQYNGWFTFAILSIFVRHLENLGVLNHQATIRLAAKILLVSVFLTLSLSAYGITANRFVVFFGLTGAFTQLISAILLTIVFVKIGRKHPIASISWARWLLITALLSWIVKVLLQVISAFPQFTTLIFTSRDMIMFYLHLMYLGVASCFILGMWIQQLRLDIGNLFTRAGIILLFIGIILTEGFISLRSFPQYLSFEIYSLVNISLLIASAILLISVLLILAGSIHRKPMPPKPYHLPEQ